LSIEFEINIFIALLQPQIGKSIEDELVME